MEMKASIEKDLAAAEPALVAAAAALDSINKKDLGELKNLKSPARRHRRRDRRVHLPAARRRQGQDRCLVEGLTGHDEGRQRLPRHAARVQEP